MVGDASNTHEQALNTGADNRRAMLEILEVFWASRVGLSLCPLITSLKMKVFSLHVPAEQLTKSLVGEKARITAAGGFVDFGRVNGNLALSRAIGDFEFKKSAGLAPEQQIVTAYPDVVVHEIADDDEFLVVACDGELMISEQFVRETPADGHQAFGTASLLKL